MRRFLEIAIAFLLLAAPAAAEDRRGAREALAELVALLQPPPSETPPGPNRFEPAQTCPSGQGLCPGRNTCCPFGTLCTNDGYCMQEGRVYCGGGQSCNPGTICTNCNDGLKCTTDGRCRVAAAHDPNCTQWSQQADGSLFRVCIDDRGMRYCERATNNFVSRVICQ